MGATWLAAFTMLALLLALVIRPVEQPQPDFSGADIAVIGSSLTQSAFPPRSGDTDTLFADGRSHYRVGMPAARPEEMEDFLAKALADDVSTVLLEVRPFLFVHANQLDQQICAGLICRARKTLNAVRGSFLEWQRAIRGLDGPFKLRLDKAVSPAFSLDRSFAIDGRLEVHYPLSFLQAAPGERLRQLIRRAKDQGTEVILYLPPRSPTASNFIGPSQLAELSQRASHYARELDLPLFVPRAQWSDADFIDQAHLGRSGREKFLADLRAWRDPPL